MLSGAAKLTVDVPARFEYLSLTGNSVLENSNVITVATEFRWVSGNIMGTWRDSVSFDYHFIFSFFLHVVGSLQRVCFKQKVIKGL